MTVARYATPVLYVALTIDPRAAYAEIRADDDGAGSDHVDSLSVVHSTDNAGGFWCVANEAGTILHRSPSRNACVRWLIDDAARWARQHAADLPDCIADAG